MEAPDGQEPTVEPNAAAASQSARGDAGESKQCKKTCWVFKTQQVSKGELLWVMKLLALSFFATEVTEIAEEREKLERELLRVVKRASVG